MGANKPDEPLEGEIVPRAPGEQRNRTGSARHNAHVDEDMLRSAIDDRVSGMTLRAVGEKYGVSLQTVANWCGEDRRNRTRAEAATCRAEASQHLDTARRKAWELYRLGQLAHQPKMMFDALIRIESITNSKAKLEGAIMPVRVDMQVTAVTQAEQELQDMINEAKAGAAAAEAAVIAAASADPDL